MTTYFLNLQLRIYNLCIYTLYVYASLCYFAEYQGRSQMRYRTNYCGEISTAEINKEVSICGWVHNRRDLGGLIFLEIRDRTGLVQVVVNPDAAVFNVAERARKEYVVCVSGTVQNRPEGTVNNNIPTGTIEIQVQDLEILNTTVPLPFYPDDNQVASEEVRLKYRYLDLRRSKMQENLLMRAKVNKIMRDYLTDNNFLEIETPILTKATPEGARDYLVPSRVNPGNFYALPQSPQLFKQLLMVSGFDRYYQIVRCFRDEDLRADRQPEFSQIDLEMSFVEERDVMQIIEQMVTRLFKEAKDIELPSPFPHMTYADAVQKYGIDRPDLRNPLVLVDIELPMFAEAGRTAAICAPQAATKFTRKTLDQLTDFAKKHGAATIAYIKVNDVDKGREGLQSSLLKNIEDDQNIADLIAKTGAKTGDIIFIGAGNTKLVNESLAALRSKLGTELELITDTWHPLWVTDFPMFEQEDGRWISMHHPFTSPKVTNIEEFKNTDPASMLSRSYDLVVNGTEFGSGSVRIADQELQSAVFDLLGISADQADEKFGFLLQALKSGCPPHGGMALGIDRMVMWLCGTSSIRDVTAFPKTQSASCLMTEAPSDVNAEQLQELGIKKLQTTNTQAKSDVLT